MRPRLLSGPVCVHGRDAVQLYRLLLQQLLTTASAYQGDRHCRGRLSARAASLVAKGPSAFARVAASLAAQHALRDLLPEAAACRAERPRRRQRGAGASLGYGERAARVRCALVGQDPGRGRGNATATRGAADRGRCRRRRRRVRALPRVPYQNAASKGGARGRHVGIPARRPAALHWNVVPRARQFGTRLLLLLLCAPAAQGHQSRLPRTGPQGRGAARAPAHERAPERARRGRGGAPEGRGLVRRRRAAHAHPNAALLPPPICEHRRPRRRQPAPRGHHDRVREHVSGRARGTLPGAARADLEAAHAQRPAEPAAQPARHPLNPSQSLERFVACMR